jgi:hypothetical protein
MLLRTSMLALAVAAVAATYLSPADAAVFGPRHVARGLHSFALANRVAPGVSLCKRGIVYVCQ